MFRSSTSALILTVMLCPLAACSPEPALRPIPAGHPARPDSAVAAVPRQTLPHAEPSDERAATIVQHARYRCPMHHHVTSDDPEATCPECGMKINEPIPGEAGR